MPRNRYTALVRRSERIRTARLERDLIELTRQLRRGLATPIELPLLLTAKQRRSARLEQKRQRKPQRSTDNRTTSA